MRAPRARERRGNARGRPSRPGREIADRAARDRGREPVVAAREEARHEAAVAVAGHREPLRVGDALADQLVDRLEEVLRVRLAPAPDRRGPELRAVAVAPARIEQQHGPATRCQLLVVEVNLVGGCVPGVVGPAVHVQEQRSGLRRVRIAHDPAVHDGAVRDGELPLLARIHVDLGEAGAVLCQHRLGSCSEIDRDDLAVRVPGAERHCCGVARDGQAADIPVAAGEDRARRRRPPAPNTDASSPGRARRRPPCGRRRRVAGDLPDRPARPASRFGRAAQQDRPARRRPAADVADRLSRPARPETRRPEAPTRPAPR